MIAPWAARAQSGRPSVLLAPRRSLDDLHDDLHQVLSLTDRPGQAQPLMVPPTWVDESGKRPPVLKRYTKRYPI